jgi:hypothetical protein
MFRIQWAVVSLVAAGIALAASKQVHAVALLQNPNWETVISDFGYSDYLGDLTPNFQGREYLSGEWAAAVGHSGQGPTWLEPNFIYPDWTTNSDFSVVNPMDVVGYNDQNLPVAQSTIANSLLKIDQRLEMIDTLIGMDMGLSPKSAATGSSIRSDRYVLHQTYTITNVGEEDLSNVKFYQMLHALNGQASWHDNRLYAGGANSAYRYDTVQRGVDPWQSGDNAFEDLIGFHSSRAPTAFDNGHYGIEGPDNHGVGKPGTGIHLNIESGLLTDVDHFAPSTLWVAGAQQYSLGTLPSGGSTSVDLFLTIVTGAPIQDTGHQIRDLEGGPDHPGGGRIEFENVTQAGTVFAEYEALTAEEQADFFANEQLPSLPVPLPSGRLQLWEIEFDGQFDGSATLTFAYDPSLLPPGADENSLAIFHWTDGNWNLLSTTIDSLNHTATVHVESLSPFVVTIVPEPASLGLLACGVLAGAALVRCKKRRS